MFAYYLPVETVDTKGFNVNTIVACSKSLELQTINFALGTVKVRHRINITDRVLKVKYHGVFENSSLFSVVTVSWIGIMCYCNSTESIQKRKLHLTLSAASSTALYLNAKKIFLVAQSQKLFVTTPLSVGGIFDIGEDVVEVTEVKLTSDMGPLSSLLPGWENDTIEDLIATSNSEGSAVLVVVKSKRNAVHCLTAYFILTCFRRCQSVAFRAMVRVRLLFST